MRTTDTYCIVKILSPLFVVSETRNYIIKNIRVGFYLICRRKILLVAQIYLVIMIIEINSMLIELDFQIKVECMMSVHTI